MNRRARSRLACLALAAPLLFATLDAPAAVERAAQYYEDALARFEKRDTAGAVIQLKNALQEDPRSLAAHLLIGKAYLQMLQPDAALESFEKALKYGADRSEVTVPMAQAYLDQGKAQEVLNRFPADALTGPRAAELLVIRGLAHRRLGDMTGAAAAFEKAIAANPRSASAGLALADLRVQQGRRQESIKLIDGVIANSPSEARAYLIRGTVLQSSGDTAGALAAYDKAVSLDPTMSDARVARATLNVNLDRMDAAALDVDYFKRENPTEVRGKYLRAVVAGRKRDAAEIRTALTEVTQILDPLPIEALKSKAPDLLLLGALAHHGMGGLEKSRNYLEHFLAVQPNHLGARRLLGSILVTQKDFVGATKMLEPVLQALPNDPQTLALLANAYMARGRAELAGQFLERALAAGGSATEIHASLGFSLLQQGQQELGLQHLQTAFNKDPMASGTGLPLAVAYMRQGQPRKAVDIAQQMAKLAPGDPVVLNLLGVAKLAAEDKPGARSAFEQAVQAEKNFSAAKLNLARLDVDEGNLRGARDRLAGMLKANARDAQATVELARLEEREGRPQEAVRLLERFRSTDGRNVPVVTLLADIYMRMNEPTRALEAARAVEAYAPRNLELQSIVTRAQLATGNDTGARANLARMAKLAEGDPAALARVAALQMDANDLAGAADNVAKGLALSPNLMPARLLQVEIDLARGQYDVAAGRAAGITRARPDDPTGYRLAGDVALARGRPAEALTEYRSALAKQPSSDHAVRVFRAMLASGGADKANAFLEGWLRDKPADGIARRALAEGYLRAGNLPGARQRYEQILKDEGEDAGVLNNLANILAREGDVRAVDFARRAYKAQPADAAIQDTLGWLLVQEGSVDAGLKHLREARLRAPGNPEIRYHLAAALAKTGRKAEARQELDAVLAEHPDFEESDAARRLLRQLMEG